MLGASIYFSTPYEENEKYLREISQFGINYVFTSMQIPEEKNESQLELLKKFISLTNQLGMKLMVDISPETFRKFNISKGDSIEFLKRLEVKCVRVDYGFDYKEIKEFSDEFEVVLNASTIDEHFYNQGLENGLDFTKLIACHNFYPRKDTGLDKDWVIHKNKILKSFGLKVMMFIPGDAKKRGPVFEGLPTVESHREQSPLVNYIECSENLFTDEILVGDVQISKKELKKIDDFIKDQIITLEVENLSESDFVNRVLSNRKDVAMNVVRCVESRTILRRQNVAPDNIAEREIGTITMDNEKYGRYQGEVQIVKRPLEADERVNVIGKVTEDSKELLKYIQAGTKFRFVGVEDNENNYVGL